MADFRVWCLLIDHNYKAAFGDVFSVMVHPNARVEDLKKKVKEEQSDILDCVHTAMLFVWRCENSGLLADLAMPELEETLSKVDFTDKTRARRPGIGRRIITLDLSDGEILLVQLPNRKPWIF